MSKRANLPYTMQDLFPQVQTPLGTLGSMGSMMGSVGSLDSSGSGTFTPASNSSRFSRLVRFAKFRTMFKRLFKPTTLDFETAVWEIFQLIVNPKKLYSSHYYYKQQTANGGRFSYTRDDPSFLILLTSFLSISALAWGLAYSPQPLAILRLVVYMVFIDFYLTGFIIATISWFITNKLFNPTFVLARASSNYNHPNYIEWGFCFDIHCNSFLVIWCLLYCLQFLLLPLLRIKNSIFSVLLGNSLYFGSVGYYFIVSFYGFNSLPFITSNTVDSRIYTNVVNPAKLLQMIVAGGIVPALAVGWIITSVWGFNVADAMVDTYFN